MRTRFALLSLVLVSSSAFAQDSYTTRIEPRQVYGATTTIEHGVRVTRPLPPVRQVIINPGSLTPLNLGSHEYYGAPYYPPNYR